MRWLLVASLIGCGHPASGVDGNGGGDDDGSGMHDDAPVDYDGAVIVPSCPTGQWCQESSPGGSTSLAGVWAVTVNDVFAVGDNGTILRRHDNAWFAMTSNTTANLHAVWAETDNNAYAVGAGGTILHWTGTAWTAVTDANSTADLSAVWGANGNDVWIVGPSTALHWNGSGWTKTGLGGSLLGLTGRAGNDVWACGETAYVRHYTTSWSSPISPITGDTTYFAITASPTDVWVTSAVGGSETLAWNGSAWTPYGTSGNIFQSLYAASSSEVWGVGVTKVGHFTAGSWSVEQPTGVTKPLYGVSGAGGELFVVGTDGMILHRD